MSIGNLLKSHRALVVILIVAFQARLYVVSNLEIIQISDYRTYYQIAQNFGEGRGLVFTTEAGETVRNSRWPIGLPILLGTLFKLSGSSSPFVGKLLNAVLSVLTIVIIYATSLKIFNKRSAVCSALIYCFYPNEILFNNLICTEIPFTFLSTWTFYLLITSKFDSYRSSMYVGILAGLSSYIRGTNIMVFLMAFVIFAFKKLPWKRLLLNSAIILIVTLLILLPNGIRNKRLFGAFRFLNIDSGKQLWQGNNPAVHPRSGFYKPMPIPELYPLGSAEREDLAREYSPWYGEASERQASEMTPAELDDLYNDYAVAYIKSHPRKTLLLVPMRFLQLYYTESYGIFGIAYSASSNLQKVREITAVLIRATHYYYVGIVVLMLGYVIYSMRNPKEFVNDSRVIPLLIILMATVPFLITHAVDRFHFFLMPLFVIYAGAAIDAVFTKLGSGLGRVGGFVTRLSARQ